MDNEIIKAENNSEEIYSSIRSSVITAQNKVYAAVNSAMVIAYWAIGEQIYKACGENDRAEYGKNLLKYLSDPCSKIICKRPLLSRKSVKIIPPLFLLFCTHPITVTI